jgi:hypothetical protein
LCSKIVSDEVSKTRIPVQWITQAAADVSDLGRRNFSAGRWLPQSIANRDGYVSENSRGLEDQDAMKILGLGESRVMLRLDESERPV